MKAIAVITLTILAVGWFALNMRKLILLLLSGQKEMAWDRLGDRVKEVARVVFGHSKVLEDRKAGLLHLTFFYGFLVLGAGHTEHVLTGMTAGLLDRPFTLDVLPTGLFHAFLLSQDVFAATVMVTASIALIRRWRHAVPRLEPMTRDAEYILYFIIVLYITFFGYTGTAVAMGGAAGWFRPFSLGTAMVFQPLSGATVAAVHEGFYWAHLVVFLGFLNYLPYSKHAHIMAAAPNVFFRRFGPRGKPSPMDFEKTEVYGTSRVSQFTWKTLLDSFACTECGRCNSVCPAFLTGKPLQPRKVVHDIKDNLLLNKGALLMPRKVPAPGADVGQGDTAGAQLPDLPQPLISKAAVNRNGSSDGDGVKPLADGSYPIHGSIHVDEAWACTTCGACMEACPVIIESVPANLMEIRRHQVLMESDFPHSMTSAFKNLEGQGNPWGNPADEREAWCQGLDVPVMREKKSADVLLWVGCMGATDDRAKKVQVALVKILKAAKVDFAILGSQEKCTGDHARRMGNEYLFQTLCQENQATLGQYSFKEILTTCPHCLNTLKNEYQDYGAPAWKVRHHTEFIDELIRAKRLNLTADGDGRQKITFHDPCYLGRYNKVYDAPRSSLKVLNNTELVEMTRTRESSFCCGAGGGRMFMEEPIGKRVNIERTEQALATGADTVAVGCPFCMTMISDGGKAKGVEERLAVKDVAELVAARLVSP